MISIQGNTFENAVFNIPALAILFRLPSVNTLRPRQNGHHFPEDIFKWIFLNENVWISINISWKFVPKGPITSNIGSGNGLAPTRRQAIIWTNGGKITDAYMQHSASMS